MTKLTDATLAELERLEREAMRGPVTLIDKETASTWEPRWSIEGPKEALKPDKPYVSWPVVAECRDEAEAKLFTAARNALPSLLAEVRRLRGLVARLEELDGATTSCPCCPRMTGARHYRDCALFAERASRFCHDELDSFSSRRGRPR